MSFWGCCWAHFMDACSCNLAMLLWRTIILGPISHVKLRLCLSHVRLLPSAVFICISSHLRAVDSVSQDCLESFTSCPCHLNNVSSANFLGPLLHPLSRSHVSISGSPSLSTGCCWTSLVTSGCSKRDCLPLSLPCFCFSTLCMSTWDLFSYLSWLSSHEEPHTCLVSPFGNSRRWKQMGISHVWYQLWKAYKAGLLLLKLWTFPKSCPFITSIC